jgi:hypothetical protein
MMIANVVRNYLRWFTLQKCKRVLHRATAEKMPWSLSRGARQIADRVDHGRAQPPADAA